MSCMRGTSSKKGSETSRDLTRQCENVPGAHPVAWTRSMGNPFTRKLQPSRPSFWQTLPLIPLGIRMMNLVRAEKGKGKLPFMDPMNPWPHSPTNGVPLGGIGCGGIGRGWCGSFNRWSTALPLAGVTVNAISPACAFHVACEDDRVTLQRSSDSVPSPVDPAVPKSALSSWRRLNEDDCAAASYAGLFPASWTHYPTLFEDSQGGPVAVTIKAVSPVLPGDYAWSAMPFGVFDIEVQCCAGAAPGRSHEATMKEAGTVAPDTEGAHVPHPRKVTVALSFANGLSTVAYPAPASRTRGEHCAFTADMAGLLGDSYTSATGEASASSQRKVHGVSFGHGMTPKTGATSWQAFSVAAEETPGVRIGTLNCFSTKTSGADVVTPLLAENSGYPEPPEIAEARGGAAAEQGASVPPCLMVGDCCPAPDEHPAGGAIALRFKLPYMATKKVRIVLAWNSPVATFGSGTAFYRRHMRYVRSPELPAGMKDSTVSRVMVDSMWLACLGLAGAPAIQTLVQRWQDQVVKVVSPLCEAAPQAPSSDDPSNIPPSRVNVYETARSIPHHPATLILNETYYLVEGGSVWTAGTPALATRQDPLSVRLDSASVLPLPPLHGPETSRIGLLRRINTSVSSVLARSQGNSAVAASLDMSALDQSEGQAATLNGMSALTSSDLQAVGQFMYEEGMEYLMVNTYDVHFYASFALSTLFPALQLSLQTDVMQSVAMESQPPGWSFLMHGTSGPRKTKGAVPHDLGAPGESPLSATNIYCIHDTANWKDLPLKFVLSIRRDAGTIAPPGITDASGGRIAFLRFMWPTMHALMERTLQKFASPRGCLRNDNFADQTYDAWTVNGVSAYCGGLWIAACSALATTAAELGDTAASERWSSVAEAAAVEYNEVLWRDQYQLYSYDSKHPSISMSDFAAGTWYSHAADIPQYLETSRIRASLQTVFRNNVTAFGALAATQDAKKGLHATPLRGAVNGWDLASRSVDSSSMQSCEVWTGTTAALAAEFVYEGMYAEAAATLKGLSVGIYESFGFWFATPEAWLENGAFRSLGYMRPLGVWAVVAALLANPSGEPSGESSGVPKELDAPS